MSTYAIGDLQGCLTPLLRLLDVIRFDPAQDQLWFTGDLVNRGPESLATLEFIRGLGQRAKCVLGNHDLHLLAAAAGFGKKHHSDTIEEILHHPKADELIDWMRQHPLAYTDPSFPNVMMVHAGLLPQWSAEKALALSEEVSAVLRSDQWKVFMGSLYGNKPEQWHDTLEGADRLRVIVNALTRMRLCDSEGRINLKLKEGLEQVPEGLYPWFDAPDRQHASHRVIIGHWSTLGLQMRPDLLALDTGCVWGGCLTAVRLEDDAVFKVECEKSLDPIIV